MKEKRLISERWWLMLSLLLVCLFGGSSIVYVCNSILSSADGS